ncbi:hypothetical protein N8766_04595 [bacterium]|nr:hypothetical protein [bacterium]
MSSTETATAPTAEKDNNLMKTLDHGIKLVTDFGVLPGSSQILNGNYSSGLSHAAVGITGRVFLGPVGWVLTAANSYAKSTTDKHIWNLVADKFKEVKTAKAEKTEETELSNVKSIMTEYQDALSKKPAERSSREAKLVESLGGK